jgi:hypothetical protein
MNRRKILQMFVILTYVAILIAAIQLRVQASKINDDANKWLYDLLITFLVSIGVLLFQSVRDKLQEIAKHLFTNQPPKFRILMYGLGRSGKSTIIDCFLKVDDQIVEHIRTKSTPNFTIQDADITLRATNKKYPISVADYKGQKPAEIVTDVPESFFGFKNQRRINVILFVVDMFPEPKDDDGEIIDNDEPLIKRYKLNAVQRIKKQVDENKLYLNKFSLQPVFTVSYSKDNLIAVRLLINKADILQEIISRGYLRNASVYDYATALYSDTIEAINSYCEENEIDDFSVRIISASRGLLYTKESQPRNVRPVFGELLKVYSNKQGD